MNPLLWVIALLAVGLAVMVLEVFVPSGGVLGFVSVVALLAAVATAFMELGPMAGMTVLAITVVSVPTVLGLAFRWFPETPLGRRVLPAPPDVAEMLPDAPHRRRTRDLIGHRGRAASDLLPWGSVAVAKEQEMIAGIEESRAALVESEAEVPRAIADSLASGGLGSLDYYKLRNLQADTDMRRTIAGSNTPGVTAAHQ